MVETLEQRQRKRIRVRAYAAADHQAAVDLFVENVMAYPENEEQLHPNWAKLIDMSVNDDYADIDGVYFAQRGYFWVATCDGEDGQEEIVGTIALQAKPENEGELRRLTVKSTYQRCGIGKLLVATLEKWAKENGITRITLGTGKVVVAARKFYEALGYTHFDTVTYGEAEVFLFEKRIE